MANQFEQGHEHRGLDKREAYGVAAVTQALSGINFSATKEEILEQAKGHEEIHWTKEETFDLRSLLDQADQEQFNSMPKLVETISQNATK